MSFIGGNLSDIEASAARLAESGSMAVASGTDTRAAAVALSEAVDDAMTALVTRFEAIAESLSADIAQSHSVLVGSDWQGQSRENALAIKEQLQGQVNGVLGTATTNLAGEKAAFISRANVLVESVQSDFQRVMVEIDNEYNALAAASRRTRENLEMADQTIRMS